MTYPYHIHIYFIHKDKEGNHEEFEILFNDEKSANKEFKRIFKAIREDKVIELSSHKCAIPTSQIFTVAQTESK